MHHRLVFWHNISNCIVSQFFFCASNICSYSFKTLSVWNRKMFFLRSLYSWLLFYLQHNPSSLSLYSFPSSGALVLKHHYSLHLSLLLNTCLIGTLLAFSNNSKLLLLLLFIIYHQSFLIMRTSALLHPHHWALPLLTMENMCLATTFTLWEGYARNNGTGISS